MEWNSNLWSAVHEVSDILMLAGVTRVTVADILLVLLLLHRCNNDPTERYVCSPKGSAPFRLHSWDSGYSVRFLACPSLTWNFLISDFLVANHRAWLCLVTGSTPASIVVPLKVRRRVCVPIVSVLEIALTFRCCRCCPWRCSSQLQSDWKTW